MLHEFLDSNRQELIERCRAKVQGRATTRPSASATEFGVPLFLGQLIDTLRSESTDPPGKELLRAQPNKSSPIMGMAAGKHGEELFRRGYTVDQVIRDYGDLCQAVTELATERREPVSTDEFRTLNGCLDNAIADSVTEFARQRDRHMVASGDRAMSERLDFLASELRSCLNTAMLAFAAIEGGRVGLRGATADVLKDSRACRRDLIDRPFLDARLAAGSAPALTLASVDRLIDEVRLTAAMDARARDCELNIEPVAPDLVVKVDRQLFSSALSNLLQNALKFTRPGGQVNLKAYGKGERAVIEVHDECSGLSQPVVEALGNANAQAALGPDEPGMAIAIARRALELMDGKLLARALPGAGCIFSIDLPLFAPEEKPQ